MRLSALVLSLALISLFALPLRAQSAYPETTTAAEAELGAKTAERIEKEFKLVKDDAAIARLNAITAAIAPVTQRPKVAYQCKILDTGALNAMVIPGGTIYVTRGLLQAVESDHELAGVLAHEVAHNALCHAQKMIKREAQASLAQIASVLVAVYASRDSEVSTGQLLTMSELVKRSLMNGYSVDLEIEADEHAVNYLHKLGAYNPLGLYSVILGLRQIEKHRPPMELYYLKTHPYSDDRKALLESRLEKLDIPINLWQVVDFRASAQGPQNADDKGYVVRLGSVVVATLTEADGDRDAKARADAAASAINRQLQRSYLQQYDVDLAMLGGNAVLRMRRIPVLTLTDADAKAAGMALPALGEVTLERMREAFWREIVKREG